MSKPYCFTIKFPWKIIQASHKCQTRKNIAKIKQEGSKYRINDKYKLWHSNPKGRGVNAL